MCCMYKIRITGTEVSVLGRYSNAPDGVVFGYTLNVTNLPVFNNELESVTIGTNIVSTYPSAHAETLAPRICVLEERSDGTYYVFKTKFPAQTVTLNKGNNTVNFSGKVTAYKGDDYYLIFCDGNNKIVSTPIKVSVIGEEGGTGFIECSGYKLGNFNVGKTQILFSNSIVMAKMPARLRCSAFLRTRQPAKQLTVNIRPLPWRAVPKRAIHTACWCPLISRPARLISM